VRWAELRSSRSRSSDTTNLTLTYSNIEKILRSPKEAEPKLRALGFEDGKGAIKNLELLSTGSLRDKLDMVLDTAISSPSPDGALNNLETIVKEIPAPLFSEFLSDDKNLQRLMTVCGSSPFLSGILARNPVFFKGLFSGGALFHTKVESDFRSELTALTAEVKDFAAMAKTLRLYKQKEFLRLGSRDLLGLSSVEELTGELSDLASASLSSAIDFSLRELKGKWGRPLYAGTDGSIKEAGFAVIGLGKLGGRELNFSSDIDIIYIYSSDKGETEGGKLAGISLHEFFVKLSHEVNKLISSVTEDGFVFRIDLDLRPDGRSGDMANSLRSLEVYYESWGQTWERSAMIKARPVAGDPALGKAFLDMIRPFVFRRYLDFGSIEEIKSMKERIDLSLLRRNPDTVDVKLGQGGIREIEFFCQALQLINGGKDPDVREKKTLKAIERLFQKRHINEVEAGVLKEGYVFLRRLEHRIQIVEGRQSQAIPASPKELESRRVLLGGVQGADIRDPRHLPFALL
jgi:[glutamine synthetase] adenylyltransferase / [glutamine synthetase]-adenylyl-L-tyrosine phosphorylase